MSFTDGIIHVDYSHMDNAADDLVQQTKAIDQTLTNLDAELEALKATWLGSDSDAYKICHQNWTNAVTAMEKLLIDHSALLTDVSQNYRYTEKSLTQLWEDIKVQA
ncbi:WXG100 family type VII secretion target [Streptomyces violaceorubidus]|uniref:ESAT-6-like protein n=1 Tax=Streptomyces violaceorubidus TaxID=284042 RepID=A0ABV1SV68_9ACTN